MHKKRIIFLVVIMLLLTGCTELSNNVEEIVLTLTSTDGVRANTASTNYELYLPIGVKQEFDSNYNQKFKINNRYVYMYVDTISYYYGNKLNYKEDDNYNYYYRKIEIGNKTGYVGINKEEDDLYFTEIVYNYSKMEFYSDLEDLPTLLANSLIIIKSIKYNDDLIKIELDSDNTEGRELKYQLDTPKDTESKFNDYLQEYVAEEDDDNNNEVVLPDDN